MTSCDVSKWSGDGALTQQIVERLQRVDSIALLRVEDAAASRVDALYNFISNEIFVAFVARSRREPVTRFGLLPFSRLVSEPAMSLVELELILAEAPDVGPPDYADDGMLQYLRTERIVPPYQRRGYKQVELVRIYAVGAGRRVPPSHP